jgi:hypothetical protein
LVNPLKELIVATPVIVLDQVPPAELLPKVVVWVTQRFAGPVIGPGKGLEVITRVEIQPEAVV